MFNLNTFVLILNASNSKLWYISLCNVNILGCDTVRIQQYSKLSTHPAKPLLIIGYGNTRNHITILNICTSHAFQTTCQGNTTTGTFMSRLYILSMFIHLPGQYDYWYLHVLTVYLVCVHPLARAIRLLVLSCSDCISCLCSYMYQ